MKITENLGEFQKFIDSDSKTGLCLEDTIRFFDIQRIFGQFESIKQSGIRVTLIMTNLMVMLFYRSRNIHSYFSRQFGKLGDREGSKNPYYDVLGNENISWRTILYLFAKRYLNLSGRIVEYSGKIRALIFDDSPIEKSGKKIEAVSKMHDHVIGRYIFGYKLLICGYWDGNNFIPVDFSLHRERGGELDKARAKRNRARRKAKQAEAGYREHRAQHLEKRAVLNSLKEEMNACSKKTIAVEFEKQEKRVSRSKKKQSKLRGRMKQAQTVLAEKEELVSKKEKKAPLYGLTPSQRRKQFRKKREKDSPGYERRSEADMSKTQSVIKMLSRAVKRGFEFDYVLFDSWFFSKEILARIESYRTKGIKLIAMVKMGKNLYRDYLSDRKMDATTLRKRYRNKETRNRKFNARYIKVPVWYDNRRVNLFFVKLGSGSKWKAFITNDLEIGFNKLMEIYHIRWSCEVFFKDAKQHLQLGKCQCNNFDSQVGEILKVDCWELFEEIIRDNQKAEEIMRIFSPVLEKKLIA